MKILYAIHRYDVFMFTWLMNVRLQHVLAKISRYVSKSGDGLFYIVIAALAFWQKGIQSHLLHALVLAFIIERPLYFLLKNSCKRNRPEAALQGFSSFIKPSDQFSFPSGHTSAAFMVAVVLANFMPALLFFLFAWSTLVGFSRIALGVHFPTDIVVGALMGSSVGLLSLECVI
jgi:undecaprenyl-diphosphatase